MTLARAAISLTNQESFVKILKILSDFKQLQFLALKLMQN